MGLCAVSRWICLDPLSAGTWSSECWSESDSESEREGFGVCLHEWMEGG